MTQLTVKTTKGKVRHYLLPVLFLAVHWLVINIVATLAVLLLVFVHNQGQDLFYLFSDLNYLNELLAKYYPLISIVYSLALIPAYSIYLKLSSKKKQCVLHSRRIAGSTLLATAAVTVGLVGVTNVWFTLLVQLSQKNAWLERVMTDYEKTAGAFTAEGGYLWLILGIGILTPIAEELLFRGIILGHLELVLPRGLAVLVQGVIFALFHMQPVQISYVLLPGIMLGLVYVWTESIWVPIAMHVLFNILGSVLPALIQDDQFIQQIVGLAQLAFILIGLLSLIYLYQKRRTSAGAT